MSVQPVSHSDKSIASTPHTPGPWHVSALDGRTCGPSRLLVCDGAEVPQLHAVAIVTLRTGETDANARLIAAAPDLLQALHEVIGDCYALDFATGESRCNFCCQPEREPHDADCTMHVVLAAIAKAEGTS